jgi:acetylornithine/succinyldiaminopimelate/putrescine aminotransferase
MEKVYENGNYFISELKKLQEEFPKDIKEVRGRGYMIGIELNYEGAETVSKLREKKILITCTSQNVLRILPPLITEKEHIDIFLKTFRELLKENK